MTLPQVFTPLSDTDHSALAQAVDRLERTSLAARLSNVLGRQIELAGHFAPDRARGIANRAATLALRAGMRAALRSLVAQPRWAGWKIPSLHFHKALASVTGAAGGAFGLAGLPVELPASTLVMLRAIADIAREEGEDLHDPDTALACLEVFALGGPADRGPTEGGYYAIRGLLAKTVSQAARYLVEHRTASETAPVLIKVVAQIAARFGFVVSQKLAVQAIPIIGAVSGAAINYAFVDHFQTLARGHFTVRRLERLYGADVVRAAYQTLRDRQQERPPARVA